MQPFVIQSSRFIKSAFGLRDFLRDGRPQAAFAGRSNVGKSSLINALLGRRKLARISSTPGRTREINYYLVNEAFYFVDLPGYGYAKVSRSVSHTWRPMVEGYIHDNASLRLMIVILDARRIPGSGDLELIDWLQAAGVSFLPVLTKRDKLSKNEFRVQEGKIRAALGISAEASLIAFSARTREGRDSLLEEIGQRVMPGPSASDPLEH